jgi:hypothetical protein
MDDPDGTNGGRLALWAFVLLLVLTIIVVEIALILSQPRY